jgi:hypothetical protein
LNASSIVTRRAVAGIANGRKITDFLLCEYSKAVPKVTSEAGCLPQVTEFQTHERSLNFIRGILELTGGDRI